MPPVNSMRAVLAFNVTCTKILVALWWSTNERWIKCKYRKDGTQLATESIGNKTYYLDWLLVLAITLNSGKYLIKAKIPWCFKPPWLSTWGVSCGSWWSIQNLVSELSIFDALPGSLYLDVKNICFCSVSVTFTWLCKHFLKCNYIKAFTIRIYLFFHF